MAALDLAIEAGFVREDLVKLGEALGHIGRNISPEGLKFIATYESFRSEVYYCAAGKPTIGYGHVVRPGESFEGGITEDEALQLLY